MTERLDAHIGSGQRWPQERSCGALAETIRDCQVVPADALLIARVEVGVVAHAGGAPGFDKQLMERYVTPETVRNARVGDFEWPTRSARIRCRNRAFTRRIRVKRLQSLEVRKHVRVGPAGAELLRGPALEVAPVSAHEHHTVDAARAAPHFASRPVHAALLEVRLRHRLVAPVVALRVEVVHQRGGHVERPAPVPRACLQQTHAAARVGAQAVREHTAGTAAANDQVVELIWLPLPTRFRRHTARGSARCRRVTHCR